MIPIKRKIAWAKNNDLNLKINFPLIKTEIFLLENDRITIKPNFNPFNNFNDFIDYFNNKIKIAGSDTELIEDTPQNYIRKIKSIEKGNFYQKDALFYNDSCFYEMILQRFPNINYKTITNEPNGNIINIVFGVKDIVDKENLKKEIEKFIDSFNHSNIEYEVSLISEIKQNLIKEPIKQKNIIKSPSDIDKFYSYQTTSKLTGNELNYIKNDDLYFYENIEKIYNGKIAKDEVCKHFGLDDKKSKILVDCSVFNSLDLRYLLAMYEEIYLILPLNEQNFTQDFYDYNRTSKDDLLKMIKKGRIKFVIAQPEIRLDSKLLSEAYEINKNSIISRRALQILTASYLVDLNENYLFYQKPFQDSQIFKEIDKLYSASYKDPKNYMLKNILYFKEFPRKMLFTHLSKSHYNGNTYLSISDGIMNNLKTLQNYSENNKIINDEFFKKIEFELMFNEYLPNIALVLGAFVSPRISSDSKYQTSVIDNLLCNYLSCYEQLNIKNFDFEGTRESVQGNLYNPKIDNSKLPNLATIPIFTKINEPRSPTLSEFDNHLPKNEVEPLNKLLIELIELPEEERKHRINIYNNKMNDIMNINEKSHIVSMIIKFSLSIITPNSFMPLVMSTAVPLLGKSLQSKEGKLLAKVSKCIELSSK